MFLFLYKHEFNLIFQQAKINCYNRDLDLLGKDDIGVVVFIYGTRMKELLQKNTNVEICFLCRSDFLKV